MKPKPKPVREKKTKKRKKKSARQLILRDLDNLIREIVFARDPLPVPLVYRQALSEYGAIESTTRHSGVHHPGHIISRSKQSVRWDLRNVHRQDANDNLLHEYFPEVYITWFIRQFGSDEWDKLFSDSLPVQKYTMDDYETMYIELTEILKKQEQQAWFKPYFSQKEIISGAWRT